MAFRSNLVKQKYCNEKRNGNKFLQHTKTKISRVHHLALFVEKNMQWLLFMFMNITSYNCCILALPRTYNRKNREIHKIFFSFTEKLSGETTKILTNYPIFTSIDPASI